MQWRTHLRVAVSVTFRPVPNLSRASTPMGLCTAEGRRLRTRKRTKSSSAGVVVVGANEARGATHQLYTAEAFDVRFCT